MEGVTNGFSNHSFRKSLSDYDLASEYPHASEYITLRPYLRKKYYHHNHGTVFLKQGTDRKYLQNPEHTFWPVHNNDGIIIPTITTKDVSKYSIVREYPYHLVPTFQLVDSYQKKDLHPIRKRIFRIRDSWRLSSG